jgi:hypothetical protein
MIVESLTPDPELENDIRTHRSLDKDAPVSGPVQRIGIIGSHAILGGLHHHYIRVFRYKHLFTADAPTR